jgi:LCP family protein required for cell wall assembly
LDLDRRAIGPPLVVLVVASDGRRGLPHRLRRLRADVDDRRADALGLLVLDEALGTPVLLRVPRDVFATVPDVGQQPIGWALSFGGPQALIDAVRSLGVPVHHYVEIGFASFARAVTFAGGLPVRVAGDHGDTRFGLVSARHRRIGGRQALASARSRNAGGDLEDRDRIEVQGVLLEALCSRLTPARLFTVAATMATRLGKDLIVDRGWTTAEIEAAATLLVTGRVDILTLETSERRPAAERRCPVDERLVSSMCVLDLKPGALALLRSLAIGPLRPPSEEGLDKVEHSPPGG